MLMRGELPSPAISHVASTALCKQIELIHARSNCICHVSDLFCVRSLFIFFKKIVEISGYSDRHMQVLSVNLVQIASYYDYLFDLFNSIHLNSFRRPSYALFFARPDRFNSSQSLFVWSAYAMPNSAIASANASPVPM